MADNVAITPGSGATVAADDVGGALWQRVKLGWGPDGTGNDTDVASGKALPTQIRHSSGKNILAGEYETVAASQTAQVLGATGGSGDYIDHVVIIPATTSPGNVVLLDNATSMTIFAGGTDSVSNLVPFAVPLGMISVSGAWKLTTGANVSCIGVGDFT